MNKRGRDNDHYISNDLSEYLNNPNPAQLLEYAKNLKNKIDSEIVQNLNDYFHIASLCMHTSSKFTKRQTKEILGMADDFFDEITPQNISKFKNSLTDLYLNLKDFISDSPKDDYIAAIQLSTHSNFLLLNLIDWNSKTLETLVLLSRDNDFLTQTLVSLVEDDSPLRIKPVTSPLVDHPRCCPLLAFLVTFVAHFKAPVSLPLLPMRLKSDRVFVSTLIKDVFAVIPYSSAATLLLAQISDQFMQANPVKSDAPATCELIMELIDKLNTATSQRCYCNRHVDDTAYYCALCRTGFHKSCLDFSEKNFTCLKCSLAPSEYNSMCLSICTNNRYNLDIISELKTPLNASHVDAVSPKSFQKFIFDYLFSEHYNFNKFAALLNSHLLQLIDEFTAMKLLIESNTDLISIYLFKYLTDEDSNLSSLKRAIEELISWAQTPENADKIIGNLHDEFASKLISVILFGKSTLKKSLVSLIFTIFTNSSQRRVWNALLPPIAVLLLDQKIHQKLAIKFLDDFNKNLTSIEDDTITFKLMNMFYYSHINPLSILHEQILEELLIRLCHFITLGNTKPLTALKNISRWAPNHCVQCLDMLFISVKNILTEQSIADFSHILLAIDIILSNVDEITARENVQAEFIFLFEKIIKEFSTEQNLAKNSFSLMCKIGARIGIKFNQDTSQFTLIKAFLDPVQFQKSITTYLPPSLGVYNLAMISSIYPSLLLNNKLQIIIADFLKENNSYFVLTTNILNDILMSPRNTTELQILTAISEIINRADPKTNYSKFNAQLLYLLSRKFIIEIDEIVPKIISQNYNTFWPENIGNLFIFFNTTQTEILGTILANSINFLFEVSTSPELKYLEFVFILALSTRENKVEKTRLLCTFLKELKLYNFDENSLGRLQRMILAVPLAQFNLNKIKQTLLDSVKKCCDQFDEDSNVMLLVDNFAKSLDVKSWTK